MISKLGASELHYKLVNLFVCYYVYRRSQTKCLNCSASTRLVAIFRDAEQTSQDLMSVCLVRNAKIDKNARMVWNAKML